MGSLECETAASLSEALGLFADRMAGSVKYSSDEILSVLNYEVGEGNLKLTGNNGKYDLEWVDYL